jgi:hypothetical protein
MPLLGRKHCMHRIRQNHVYALKLAEKYRKNACIRPWPILCNCFYNAPSILYSFLIPHPLQERPVPQSFSKRQHPQRQQGGDHACHGGAAAEFRGSPGSVWEWRRQARRVAHWAAQPAGGECVVGVGVRVWVWVCACVYACVCVSVYVCMPACVMICLCVCTHVCLLPTHARNS